MRSLKPSPTNHLRGGGSDRRVGATPLGDYAPVRGRLTQLKKTVKHLISLFAISLALATTPANAQITTITRVDGMHGNQPTYTLGIMMPEIELWGFTFPSAPDIEIGRLWRVYKHSDITLSAGVYGTYWTNPQQYFAEPWIHAELTRGKLGLTIDVASYLPLNGGPTVLYADEIFAGYKVSPQLTTGLASAFWSQSGTNTTWGVGPGIKYSPSKRDTIGVRYLFGGSDSTDSFRLEWRRNY